MLWVGMAVRETDAGDVPQGVELLTVPERLCACLRVNGDEAHMEEAYRTMFGWLNASDEYELDTGEGVLGLEANRLSPVNPFAVPYSEVEVFDYEMQYAIRCKERPASI